MRTHQRWTARDREQLKELSSVHCSDYMIARVMGRTASAVSWQRRKLRIRFGKHKPQGAGCASWIENVNYPAIIRDRLTRQRPIRAAARPPKSEEPMSRVDALMALASRSMA